MNNPLPAQIRFLLACAVISLVFITPHAPAESILLQNAIVHTVSGNTYTNGGVLMDGDKIKLVLDGKSPEGILANKIIDLKGQHLYPGLIAMNTVAGLSEIEAVRATQDGTEVGDYTPDVQSWLAVNPDSELLPVARANGITHFEPAPQGGVVSGMSGVVALDGWTTEQMTIKHLAALHVRWPDMDLDTTPKEKFKDKEKYKSLEDQAHEREKKLTALTQFFLEARAYAASRDALTKPGVKDPGINPPWEAMLPVIRSEVPIMIHADDVRQIKSAVAWAQTNNLKITIVGGRDAWRVAKLLADQKIAVVYESLFNQPNRDYDSYDVNFTAASVLHAAGVTVAFGNGPGSFQAALAKNLPYLAAQAVAFGLPESEALKGITLYPAQLLGIGARLGSIEVGKEATLFVCDGDILDIRSNVKQMWIAGKEVSLETRHTRLYEKYKNRPVAK